MVNDGGYPKMAKPLDLPCLQLSLRTAYGDRVLSRAAYSFLNSALSIW